MARRHADGASDARHARRRAARSRRRWSTSRSTTAFARSSKSIPGRARPVRIWSRLGNEKTAQFPDLVAALTRYAKKLKGPVVLDGEIVALDEQRRACRFSAAAEPHSPDRIQQPVRRRTRRLHRVRHPARSRRGSAAAAAHRAASAARARLPQSRARPFCERATWSRATRASSISTRSITGGKA